MSSNGMMSTEYSIQYTSFKDIENYKSLLGVKPVGMFGGIHGGIGGPPGAFTVSPTHLHLKFARQSNFKNEAL